MSDSANKFGFWIRLAGVLNVVLGIIHCLAAPYVFSTEFVQVTPDERVTAIWAFLATGGAVILSAAVLLNASAAIRRGDASLWSLAVGASLFLFAISFSGVLLFPENPFTFVGSAMALAGFVPLLLYRRSPAFGL